MADNIVLNSGTGGATLAADDITSVWYQIVKLGIGALDAVTLLSGGNGATDAGTVRVTISSDSTGVLSVDDNGAALTVDNGGTFAVQVDGSALTALQLIDDIVHADDAARSKSALVGAVFDDVAPTAITENQAGYLRMTSGRALHVAQQGTVTVDGSGVTQPVSHAALTELAAAINASSQMDVNVATALPAGDNNIGNVDIVSGTVTTVSTVTALGAGTTGPMKAEDAAHGTGDQGFAIWGVRTDTPNVARAGTDLDYSVIATNSLGSVRTAFAEDDLATAATKHVKKYFTSAGAATDGIVWSPAAGARWFVQSLYFNVSAAATVTFEDDLTAGDSAVLKGEFAANSGLAINFDPPMFSGEDAADLLVTTTAGNIYVTITGYEI